MEANEEYNFVTDPDEIIKALHKSKENQTMIALRVPSIGAGLFITCVENIIDNKDEPIAVLKQFDVTGCFFEKNKLKLSEIMSACSLQSKWKNPYIKNILKDNVPWLRIEDRL